MNINESIDIIVAYSARVNLPIVDAITKLDEDAFEDWSYTLPDAPKGHQPKTTKEEDQALHTFSKCRVEWIKQARILGLDLTGFSGLGV